MTVTRTFFICLSLLVLFANANVARNALQPILNLIVIRHGDRTPLTKFPNDDTYWNCSLGAEVSQSPMQLKLSPSVPSASARYVKRFTKGKMRGTCMLGQLTPKGMYQHYELGRRYAARIGSTLKCDDISIETTDRPRTIQSMESFMTGFLGEIPRCASSLPVLQVDTVENSIHDMFTNTDGCPYFNALQKQIQREDQWVIEHDRMAGLLEKFKREFGISQSSNVQWYQIADIILCRQSHGIPMPTSFSQDDLTKILKLYYWESQFGSEHPDYLKFGIGSFLHRIVERMERAPTTNTSVPLAFYSGHDTTIAPLLGTLGVALNGDTWPDYAANLHFQVSTDGYDRYVTVYYMEKPLQLKGCRYIDCTWNEFKTIVQPYMISPEEWEMKCHNF